MKPTDDTPQVDPMDPEMEEDVEVEGSDQDLQRKHDKWLASLTDEEMHQFVQRIKESLGRTE